MTRAEYEVLHMRSGYLEAKIEGFTVMLSPKIFASGSTGWHAQGKMVVNGTKCQVNLLVTVIGSKDAHRGSKPEMTAQEYTAAMNAVQNNTAPKNAPEAPLSESPLFPADRGKKRRSK